jgi:hypothetical protein
MKKSSKFSGDLDWGYEPIAEIAFTADPWTSYVQYHKMLEVPAEDYRPIPLGTADQLF